MSRRMWIAVTVIALTAGPVHAQLAVIDPANLAQAILIAQRTQRQLEELQAEYRTILRMAQGLGNLQRYQTPSIALSAPDPGRWLFGRPWVQALVSGDARGTLYYDSVVPLQRPGASDLSALSAEARRDFESRYATTEITDSVALTGAHQVALVRGYSANLQNAIQSLQQDIFSGADGANELTAVLDKIAVGELLARRQDTATNQLLSHALEQLLARSKRLRDTEAGNVNMQIRMWQGGAANQAFVQGTGDALRTWRQP